MALGVCLPECCPNPGCGPCDDDSHGFEVVATGGANDTCDDCDNIDGTFELTALDAFNLRAEYASDNGIGQGDCYFEKGIGQGCVGWYWAVFFEENGGSGKTRLVATTWGRNLGIGPFETSRWISPDLAEDWGDPIDCGAITNQTMTLDTDDGTSCDWTGVTLTVEGILL